MDILGIITRIEGKLKERGIPKMEFYKRCGVSASAVSQWRKGKTKPSNETLQKIASELGVSYGYLVTGERSPFFVGDSDIDMHKVTRAMIKATEYLEEEQKKKVAQLSNEEQEVVDIFRDLPADKRETALELMRAMALASKSL